MKFVSEIPESGKSGASQSQILAELRANRGQWAEIQRYPRTKKQNAYQRASYTQRAHEDIECAARSVGDEVVVYMRAVEQ